MQLCFVLVRCEVFDRDGEVGKQFGQSGASARSSTGDAVERGDGEKKDE